MSISVGRSVWGCATAALLVIGSSAAHAQDDDFVTGSAGISVNSHFVSYGADVWRGASDFYGKNTTTFVWGDAAFAFDALTINLGIWADVNDNAPDLLGGSIQEIDWTLGFTYAAGPVTLGMYYQNWNYASDVESVLDFTVGFNDSGLIAPDFALNPKATWHIRMDGNGAQEKGSVIVLSVGPSFPLGDSTVTLSIPAGIAFFVDDDFQGGTADGYGYSYFGGSFGLPLSFIPESYGAWSANFDLIAYFTDKDAIPGNPKSDFLTGSLGLKVVY